MPEWAISGKGTAGTKKPFYSTGNDKYDQLLIHSAAVGTSAVALAALARLAFSGIKSGSAKALEEENEHMIRGSNPIISPDPSLNDSVAEQFESERGLTKEQSDKHITKTAEDPYWWFKALAPMAAAAGGTWAGYTMVDKILERRKKQEIEGSVKSLSNKLDRLNYIKLMRARGEDIPIDGLEEEGEVPQPAPAKKYSKPKKAKKAKKEKKSKKYEQPEELSVFKSASDGLYKKAGPDEKKQKKVVEGYEESTSSALKAMMALMVATTVTGAGILSKKYFDNEDPRRIEDKEVNEALRALKRQEIERTPIHISAIPAARMMSLDNHLKGSPKKRPDMGVAKMESAPLDAPSVAQAPVYDKADPTMSII
jgi:hypothetical protein